MKTLVVVRIYVADIIEVSTQPRCSLVSELEYTRKVMSDVDRCRDALAHKPSFRLRLDSIAGHSLSTPRAPHRTTTPRRASSISFCRNPTQIFTVARDRRTPMHAGVLARHVHTSFLTRPSYL
jgi:hypothetical protein